MKISELTPETVARYLRIDWDHAREEDTLELESFLKAAKAFVFGFVGKTDAECDAWPDLTIAVLLICEDMYDNRSAAVTRESAAQNPALMRLLGLHDYNLI